MKTIARKHPPHPLSKAIAGAPPLLRAITLPFHLDSVDIPFRILRACSYDVLCSWVSSPSWSRISRYAASLASHPPPANQSRANGTVLKKELHQDQWQHQAAWLYVAVADEDELADEDLLAMDVRVGQPPAPQKQKISPARRRYTFA